MVETTPHPALPCKSPLVTRRSSSVCSTSCERATGLHGSGLSSTPASGSEGWRERCSAATPKSTGGRKPTTCSWRRSPGSIGRLETVKPESPRHFYNLAATQIRRVLIDMARRYCGPEGLGSHHDTSAGKPEGDAPRYEQADSSGEPSSLAEWTEFHEQVEAMPEEEREVFNLVWYEEMTHEQVAEVLGVTTRTVRRRWQDARYRLQKARLGEPLPEERP